MEVESGDESDASMSSRSSEDFLYESPSEDEDGVVIKMELARGVRTCLEL